MGCEAKGLALSLDLFIVRSEVLLRLAFGESRQSL